MTIRELIEQLKDMDQDRIVVLQQDPEGNSYCPCVGTDANAGYRNGDVKREVLFSDDKRRGFTEEDLVGPEHKPCVVLYP